MKSGGLYVCLVMSSFFQVEAAMQDRVHGTSFADAFLGAEASTGIAAKSGTDAALQRLRQRAGEALGIGASSLVVFVFMGIFAILCIAFATGQQQEEIDKLHSRARGLYQDWMAKELAANKDAAKRRALEKQLAQEEAMIKAEKERLAREAELLRQQQLEKDADKAKIAAQQAKLQSLAQADKKLIGQINARNKVMVDMDKKLFKIVEPIEFKSVRVLPSMKHAPPAEFANPSAANEVLSDLAEILKTVTQPRLMIEGHTGGGQKAVSDIGFEIACERAEKVVKTLVSLGVSKERLESKGKPGLLGDNKFDTKIITLSW